MVEEAMEIYRVVGEHHPNIPHSIINIAHILASKGQVANALKLYEKTLEKVYRGKNEQIELWIARLHYQSKNYDACQKVLKKMIYRNPEDIVLKFNLALCLQSKSVEVLNKDYREVKETKKTIEDLNLAKKIFSGLIQKHEDLGKTLPSTLKAELLATLKEKHSRILKISDERLFFIKDTLQNSERYLQHDIEMEQKLKGKHEENLRRIREIQEFEHQKNLERLRIEEEEQRIRNEKAEQNAKLVEDMAREWEEQERKKREEEMAKASTREKKDKKGKAKRKQDDFIVQDRPDGSEMSFDFAGVPESPELSLEGAENLGLGGLDDLKKEHNRKKEKKRKKDKKREKKDKHKKKSRLKRMHRDEDADEDVWGEKKQARESEHDGQEVEESQNEVKRQKFEDE